MRTAVRAGMAGDSLGRMASDAVVLTVSGPSGDREVRISSPSRVLWPDLGLTKLDLANYLVTVGEAFVRANGDRPVSLQRFPEGVDGERRAVDRGHAERRPVAVVVARDALTSAGLVRLSRSWSPRW